MNPEYCYRLPPMAFSLPAGLRETVYVTAPPVQGRATLIFHARNWNSDAKVRLTINGNTVVDGVHPQIIDRVNLGWLTPQSTIAFQFEGKFSCDGGISVDLDATREPKQPSTPLWIELARVILRRIQE